LKKKIIKIIHLILPRRVKNDLFFSVSTMSNEAKRSLLSLAINDSEDLDEVEKEWLYSYTYRTSRFLKNAEEIGNFLIFKDTMRQLRAIAYQSAHLSVHIIIPKRKRGRIVTYLKLGWMGDTSDFKDPEGSSSDEEWD